MVIDPNETEKEPDNKWLVPENPVIKRMKVYKCSNCGEYSGGKYRFCPNCGKKMRNAWRNR